MDIYTYTYLIGILPLLGVLGGVSYLTGYFRPDEERFSGQRTHLFLLTTWLAALFGGFAAATLYLLQQSQLETMYAALVFMVVLLAGTFLMSHFLKVGREAREKATSRADPWLN